MLHLLIFILILLLIFSVLFFITIYTQDVVIIDTPKSFIKNLLEEVEDRKNIIFYDLGCGNGNIIFPIAKERKNIRIIGIEIGILPYLFCQLKKNILCTKNITITKGSFNDISIKDASHVFMYLYPHIVQEMYIKIKNECRSGTKIFCIDFPIENIAPKRQVSIRNKHTLFIYEI